MSDRHSDYRRVRHQMCAWIAIDRATSLRDVIQRCGTTRRNSNLSRIPVAIVVILWSLCISTMGNWSRGQVFTKDDVDSIFQRIQMERESITGCEFNASLWVGVDDPPKKRGDVRIRLDRDKVLIWGDTDIDSEAQNVAALLDGPVVFVKTMKDGAVRHRTNSGIPFHACDFRLLGICMLATDHTLPKLFDYLRSLEVMDISPEQCGTIPSTRISLRNPKADGQFPLYVYWIDNSHPTRVLQYEVHSKFQIARIESRYDDEFADGKLPVEVVETLWSGNDPTVSPATRGVHKLSDYQTGVSIEQLGWAALDLPVGAVVSDSRINQSLGWWDGKRIVDLPPMNAASGRVEPRGQTRPTNYLKWSMLGGGAIAIVIAFIIWQRRQAAG